MQSMLMSQASGSNPREQDDKEKLLKDKKKNEFAETKKLAAKIALCSTKLVDILVWENKIKEVTNDPKTKSNVEQEKKMMSLDHN